MCLGRSPVFLCDRLPGFAGLAACARRIFNRFLITVFFNTGDRVHGGVHIRIGCISVAQQSSRRPRNGAALEALTDG